MRRVLVSAGRVLLVGVTLGVGVGVVRGVPSAEDPTAEEGACLPPVADEPVVSWIDADRASELHGGPGVVFVDARSEDAFLTGHVAGALHVPMDAGVVADDVVALLRGYGTLVAYDDTSDECARSTRLASVLVQSGLSGVRVLEGGFPAWLEAGHPAEAGTCRLCP
jgi:rhodanese-related sulfurtransferase